MNVKNVRIFRFYFAVVAAFVKNAAAVAESLCCFRFSSQLNMQMQQNGRITRWRWSQQPRVNQGANFRKYSIAQGSFTIG